MISPELFLQLAKIEGILWSISDIFLVFFFLKFVNVIRRYNGLKTYKGLYFLLFFSFALTPLLLYVPNLFYYMIIEIIVLNIQYFILIYVSVKNYRLFNTTFKKNNF